MVATQTFFNFHPKPWGFMESQFDGCIFLDMGGSKKPNSFKRPWPALLRQERDLVLLDVRDVAEHLGYFFEDVKLFQGWKDLFLTKKKTSCKKHLEAFKVMIKEMGGGVLQVLMEETC